MPPEDDYLLHYGVLGMKWGVRKDRGSSGIPGKFRRKNARNVTSRKIKKFIKGKISDSKKKKKVVQQRKALVETNPKELDDAQLRKALDRLLMEKQYKDLTKKEVSMGAKLVSSVAYKSLDQVGTKATTYGLTKLVNAFGRKYLDLDEDIIPKESKKKKNE